MKTLLCLLLLGAPVAALAQSKQTTPTRDGGHDVKTTHADGSVSIDHIGANGERMGGEYRGSGFGGDKGKGGDKGGGKGGNHGDHDNGDHDHGH
jgi:hypothetical protein